MSEPIKVEVSLGEFDFSYERFVDEEDIIQIISNKIKSQIRAEVEDVMEEYRAKVREHLDSRLDVVLQNALDKVDAEYDDYDLTQVLLGEKL